ncbi:MAG: hypothetical protein R3B47_13335 [Bacteroidia bacterium]
MLRLATFLILSFFSLGWLHSQQLKPRALAPDGTVFAMKKHGNILYVGGFFDQVGNETGGGALYSANSLKPDVRFPHIDGDVLVSIPDGNGGWFIGGNFNRANLEDAFNFAHILPNMIPDSTFLPDFNNDVLAMAVRNDTLFVGGHFTEIDGVSQQYLAAFSLTTESLLPWNLELDGSVKDLEIFGNSLVVAGSFDRIAGRSQPSLARINLNTGEHMRIPAPEFGDVNALGLLNDTLFVVGSMTGTMGQFTGQLAMIPRGQEQPSLDFPIPNGNVEVVVPDGNGGWYIGGSFTQVDGKNISRLAHILPGNLLDTAFVHSFNGPVYDIQLWNDTMLVAGTFTSIDGQTRNRIASFSLSTNSLSSWDPNADGTVRTLFRDGMFVYAGGSFTAIGGDQQSGLAKLSLSTGQSFPIICPGNGEVKTITKAHNQLFVGGSFTGASGNFTGRLGQFINGSEIPNLDFLNFEGNVETIVSDGNGGWYVGGSFTKVNGLSIARLAHILPNQLLDSAFSFSFNNSVFAIQIWNDTMLVAGQFTSVNGQAHNRLAAIQTSTNTVLPWAPDLDNTVRALALWNDTMLVAGQFTTADGQTRNRIAAYDMTSGLLTAFNPDANNQVYGLNVDGGNLYAYGTFTNIGGQARNRLAAISLASGLPTNWDPNLNNAAYDMEIDGNAVYIVGAFTQVGGQNRGRIAEIDKTTGLPTAFNPNANTTVNALQIWNDTMLVAGNFATIGGQAASRLAKVNKNTGALLSWFPNPGANVNTVLWNDTMMLAGGSFVNFQAATRNRVFSLDLGNGQLTSWDPAANGTVEQLMIWNDTMLVAGNFNNIAGGSRQRLAKINALDGGLGPLSLTINQSVNAVSLWNDTMLVAGNFTDINGTGTAYLAALDLFNDTMLIWRPQPNNQVYDLAFQNGQLAVAGQFKTFAGAPRSRGYAVDLSAQGLTPWDPDIGGFGFPSVEALAWNDTMMYLGGNFGSVRGQSRADVAAVNLIDGSPYAFQTDTDYRVNAIHAWNDTMMIIGGDFEMVNGQPRNYAAVVDANTGVLEPIDPLANSRVQSFSSFGNQLLMGGEFNMVNRHFRDNVYAYDIFNDTIMAWAPNPENLVTQIEVSARGDRVYLLSSNFNTLDKILVLNSLFNDTLFTVQADFRINEMALDPQTNDLYFGGDFNLVNGQTRKKLGGVDAQGNLLPLSLDIDGEVRALAWNDTMMYIGGSFGNIDNQIRYKLAAVHGNGTLMNWAPAHNTPSFSSMGNIVATPDRIYVNGSFTQIGGKDRKWIAALDPITGEANYWDPKIDNGLFGAQTISEIIPVGDAVLLLGDLRNVAGTTTQGVAHVSALSGRIARQIPLYGYYQTFAGAFNDTMLYLGGSFQALDKGVNKFLSEMKFDSKFFAQKVEKISPRKGGNTGDVTMTIIGQGFTPETRVILRGNGFSDIVGQDSGRVIVGGVEMRIPFILRNEPPGLRDVVIQIPGDTIVLKGAFTIEQGGKADPWADVITPNFVSRGHDQSYFIAFGNSGNIDAVGVPIWLALSPNMDLNRMDYAEITLLDTTEAFLDSIPYFVRIDTLLGKPYDANVYSLVLPKIPAGAVGTIRFVAKAPLPGRFRMRAWANDPLYGSPLKYWMGDCFDTWFGAAIGFVPVAGCAYGVFDITMSPLLDAAMDPSFGTSSYAANYAQAVAGTAVGCVLDFTTAGVGRVVAETIDQGLKAKTTLDVLEKCLGPEDKDDSEGDIVTSADPNDKSGRQGQGGLGWLRSDQVFPYLIRYENMDTATAPAKLVIIRDTLDKNVFDLNSLQVQAFTIADSLYTFPKGRSTYELNVDLRPRLPYYVNVNVDLDTLTGAMTWAFTTLDTLKMDTVTQALAGYLPPNTDSISGTGTVLYTIQTLPSVGTLDVLANRASIYFDFNDAIVTNTVINTIDNDLPQSRVIALADTQRTLTFPVSWSGSDVGSGIRYYDLFYRENGGPWGVAAEQYTDTVIDFTGVAGSSYDFYTIAYDTALNAEEVPIMPDASTFIGTIVRVADELPNDLINLFPNPNPGSFQLEVDGDFSAPMQVMIFSSMGIKVYEERYHLKPGKQQFPIHLDVAPGVYSVMYQVNGKRGSQKVVVQ